MKIVRVPSSASQCDYLRCGVKLGFLYSAYSASSVLFIEGLGLARVLPFSRFDVAGVDEGHQQQGIATLSENLSGVWAEAEA